MQILPVSLRCLLLTLYGELNMLNNIEDFDKRFNQTRKMAIWGSIIIGILSISGVGFIIWVIIKFMAHFGVI